MTRLTQGSRLIRTLLAEQPLFEYAAGMFPHGSHHSVVSNSDELVGLSRLKVLARCAVMAVGRKWSTWLPGTWFVILFQKHYSQLLWQTI